MSDALSKLANLKAVAGFFKVADIPGIEVAPGVTLQLISGEKAMFSVVSFAPGSIVPLHSHPHEQCGTVLEGEMIFYMHSMNPEDGQRCGPGDFYVAPGGTLHAATPASDQPVLALDVFSPPREDYLEMFRQKYGREARGFAPA
ncbi:MAG: cupin domain-containing protein [Chloroflexota bacterium]|nr:cupin domain-containing protein [Chloroflexota bacterium]